MRIVPRSHPARGAAGAAVTLAVAAAAVAAAVALDNPPPTAPPPLAAAVRSAAAEVPCPPIPTTAKVLRVVDGDTLQVTAGCLAGKPIPIRIIGISTPKITQCWGPQAYAYAHRILDGQLVQLRGDPGTGAADRAGRTLAHVYAQVADDDLESYGLLAVRGGYARADGDGHPYKDQQMFEDAQQTAHGKRLGLWSCP